ncbi:MAG: hypothetical protein EOP12_00020 [Pseudomonas sp.]|nr:MAG: hypothetical protein EOP12_00020 [Pseudomonas sp.]
MQSSGSAPSSVGISFTKYGVSLSSSCTWTTALNALRLLMLHSAAQDASQASTRPARLFDRPQYKKRSVIELVFSWLKEKRRICTRYYKLASSFKAVVTPACIERCLRADFSNKP